MLITSFGACSSTPPVTSGTVVDKRFEPAHWEGGWESYTDYGYTCGIDWSGDYTCGIRPHTDSRYVENHHFVNDRYKLQLEACEEKCRRSWRTVTQSEYDRYEIGNHYPNPR